MDIYAQELKKLYRHAYPKMAQDGGEEGRTMLASRFVAGLTHSLQERVMGVEGDFDPVPALRRQGGES